MYKLLIISMIFLVFSINYFYSFLNTVPYFNFIKRFNIYEYMIDNIKESSYSGLDIKYAVNDSWYVLDYKWAIINTPFKFSVKDGPKFKILVPMFIIKTGSNYVLSWDNMFSWLVYEKEFNGYYQVISGWNNYIRLWYTIKDKKVIEDTFFLGKYYIYCTNLASTWWINDYYFDRYEKWNKKGEIKYEKKQDWKFVCWKNNTAFYKRTECNDSGCVEKKYDYCTCKKENTYWLCRNIQNPENKTCNDDGKCLQYYIWTINLNKTTCNTGAVFWKNIYKKYMKFRY